MTQTQVTERMCRRGLEADADPGDMPDPKGRRALEDPQGQEDQEGLQQQAQVIPYFSSPMSAPLRWRTPYSMWESRCPDLMLTQQNVNRNMVDHLNLTAEAQDVQTHALARLVENTRQREFDKLFNAIPIYDGEDPDKFEPWLTQLENACIVGKRDVREVAICSCTGPVLEVITSIDEIEPWSVHRDELRRCFSPNKTRVHAANLLNSFRPQHATENLRVLHSSVF